MRHFVQVILLVFFAAFLVPSGSAQSTPLPKPPFTECPAIGLDTSCGLLIVATDYGTFVVDDPTQGPYDGSDDTLVGVINNSSQPLEFLPLASPSPIFAFEGDGICGVSTTTGLPFAGEPAGCPFGQTGYEGPGTQFIYINTGQTSGVIFFDAPLPAKGGTGYFSLETVIEPNCQPISGVPLLSQGPNTQYGGGPWATNLYDGYKSTDTGKTTIQTWGCALTDCAMLINYQAKSNGINFSTDPGTLNTWLQSNSGYSGRSIDWLHCQAYAYQHSPPIPLTYQADASGRPRNDLVLDNYLCSRNPVILQVSYNDTAGNPHSHFVVATGQSTNGTTPTYLINDPAGSTGKTDLTGYGNTYVSMRAFSSTVEPPNALVVVAHSPIELALSDNYFQTTGYVSPTNPSVHSMPNTSYTYEDIGDVTDPSDLVGLPQSKMLILYPAPDGTYQLQAYGTGTGAYTLDFSGIDVDGNSSDLSFTGNATPGSIDLYTVQYSSAAGSSLSVIPVPTLSSVSPASLLVNSGNSTLTFYGLQFTQNSVVWWNSTALQTTFISSTELTAIVPANLLLTAGTAGLNVYNGNPAINPVASNLIHINVDNAVPVLSSITPNTAIAQTGASANITLGGSGFVNGATLLWNSAYLNPNLSISANFVSSTQLTATIPYQYLVAAGAATISVTNPQPTNSTSNALAVTVDNPLPTLTAVSPLSATGGQAGVNLTLTGTNFVYEFDGSPTTMVLWNGTALGTYVGSSTSLSAFVPASYIASSGAASITVANPSPGGGTSSAFTFTIDNPLPTLASISPSSGPAGSGAITLTVNGTNLVPASIVNWNGAPLTTVYVGATQLNATVPAADLATYGTRSVTVTNPAPGGGTSNALTFAVDNPAPTLASILPTSTIAGGAAFTLTATGTKFTPSSLIEWGGTALATSYVSATKITAIVPAADIALGANIVVTVVNPSPGGGASAATTFTVDDPLPVISTLAPAATPAGGAAFTLNVSGSNFFPNSQVIWNGAQLATTYVGATELTASVPASDIASGGTTPVTVRNPAPGGGTSNGFDFAIENPVPTLTALSPASVNAGAAAFTLNVTGSHFVAKSLIVWNGTMFPTTFISANALSAEIPASYLTLGGSVTVAVENAAPGGGTTAPLAFAIDNPLPSITALSPTSAPAGTGSFFLTVTGDNFISKSVLNWNGMPLATTYSSATSVKAIILSSYITSGGTANVTVTNPAPAGGTSNAAVFSVNNPVAKIDFISPTSILAGSANFTLTVAGGSFLPTSTVLWNGKALATTYSSSTRISATVPASEILVGGTPSITVANPTPGGGVSNAEAFTVDNPVPTLTSLSPATVTAGRGTFKLNVVGTNFVSTSSIVWNGVALPTTFDSAHVLTAYVPAADVAKAITVPVQVTNPIPAGGTSNIQTFSAD
jgi:hypothetical protein